MVPPFSNSVWELSPLQGFQVKSLYCVICKTTTRNNNLISHKSTGMSIPGWVDLSDFIPSNALLVHFNI